MNNNNQPKMRRPSNPFYSKQYFSKISEPQNKRTDLNISNQITYKMMRIQKHQSFNIQNPFDSKFQQKSKMANIEKQLQQIQELQDQLSKIMKTNKNMRLLVQQTKESLQTCQILNSKIQEKVQDKSFVVGALSLQTQKKLLLGFGVYDNGDIEKIPLDASCWNSYKMHSITYNQIRIWLIDKLYKGNKQVLKRVSFSSHPEVFKALYEGDVTNCEEKDFKILGDYLFKNQERQNSYRLEKTRGFIAIGSQTTDLFNLMVECLREDLLSFQGYQMRICSIDIVQLPEHSSFYRMKIRYRINEIVYVQVLYLINLRKNINPSAIEALISDDIYHKYLGQFGSFVRKVLGNTREGVVWIEIPKWHPKQKRVDYEKIYSMLTKMK